VESVVYGDFDVRGAVQRKCVLVLVKGQQAASRLTLVTVKGGDVLRPSDPDRGSRCHLL